MIELTNPRVLHCYHPTIKRMMLATLCIFIVLWTHPPKKCPITLQKWGGGTPHLATTNQPTTNLPPCPTTNTGVNQTFSASIDQRFGLIYTEINQQCESNARFNERISSLEVTTNNIVSKIDLHLDLFDSSLPSKIHKAPNNSNWDSTHNPERCFSPLHHNQDKAHHA